jgi:copper chaperone
MGVFCEAFRHTPQVYLPKESAMNPGEQLTYQVTGMSCEHCKLAVTEEVAQVKGVSAVDVDLDSKLVRVSGSGVDSAAVVAAIDQAGYDAVAA